MNHVLVSSRNEPLRARLCSLIGSLADFDVIASCADPGETLQRIGDTAPDTALIDLSVPGQWQVEALQEIRRSLPRGRVLATASCTADEMVRAVLRAGWDGFVSALDPVDDLVRGLRSASQGRRFVSASLLGNGPGGPGGGPASPRGGARTAGDLGPWDRLTAQERRVLQLIAQGHTNRTAADQLQVSAKTVEKHRANLMRKLGLRDAAELADLLRERGMLGTLQ